MTCCHWMARKLLKLSHVSKQRFLEKQQVFRGSSLQSCFYRPVKFTKDLPSNLLFHFSLTTLQRKIPLFFYRYKAWNLERNDLYEVGEGPWEDMTTSWPMSGTWTNGGLTLSPTLVITLYPPCHHMGAVFKNEALKEYVLLRPSGCYIWLYKL